MTDDLTQGDIENISMIVVGLYAIHLDDIIVSDPEVKWRMRQLRRRGEEEVKAEGTGRQK